MRIDYLECDAAGNLVSLWGVDVTEGQYAVGLAAAQKSGATHHSVWSALKEAGVPIRGGRGEYPASQAASALMSRGMGGLLAE